MTNLIFTFGISKFQEKILFEAIPENEFFFSGTFVQVVGGRGKEVGMGGSKHFDPAKFRGLVLGVTDNFFFALIGSDAHFEARVFGFLKSSVISNSML